MTFSWVEKQRCGLVQGTVLLSTRCSGRWAWLLLGVALWTLCPRVLADGPDPTQGHLANPAQPAAAAPNHDAEPAQAVPSNRPPAKLPLRAQPEALKAAPGAEGQPHSRESPPASAQPVAGAPNAPGRANKPAQEAAAGPCGPENLVATARLSARGATGATHRVRDGQLAQEGDVWNGPTALRLAKTESWVQADLRRPREIRGLVVQADNNDEFIVSASLDGKRFKPLWVAPAVAEVGLRTRYFKLNEPATARYLRVSGRGGDGFYSISELRAHCQLPEPWPPELKLPPPKRYWSLLTNPLMVIIQSVVGVVAVVALLFGFALRYRWKPLKPHALRDSLLLWAGVAALWGAAHTGLWYCSLAAGVLLLLWYVVRWTSGSLERPRRLAPLAKLLCRPPAALLLAALWMALIAGTVHNLGWIAATGVVFVGVLLTGVVRLLRAPVSFQQTARIVLLCLGMFGLGSFWNFGHFHFDHFIHIWEQYHYVIGAKYGPELRYGRIYECTAAADLADGFKKRVEGRKVRQLATDNELGDTSAVIANPGLCTDHFTPDRWSSFRKDLRFFRARFSEDRWNKSQTDHGYNATPIWGVAARVVVDQLSDLSWEKIEYLGVIDVVLLLLAWGAAYRVFGFEPVCVALIYWGLNYPARYYWNGGGFLRYGWFIWLVLGLCFLRKKRMFWGGVALTYATGLRIFPGFVVATLIMKALYRMVRERRFVLSSEHVRFAAGCVVALGVLVPLSSWSMGGLDAWPEFARNSQKHMSTALTNNMGLKTVIGYDYATRASQMRDDKAEDPFKPWKDARKYFYQERMPIFVALLVLYCLLLARAADRLEDWEAACVGTGLIVMATELTCYYYGFLLAYGLMWERRKLPGILAVAYATSTAFLDRLPWNDDRYTAMSLGAVIIVVAVTAQAAFWPHASLSIRFRWRRKSAEKTEGASSGASPGVGTGQSESTAAEHEHVGYSLPVADG